MDRAAIIAAFAEATNVLPEQEPDEVTAREFAESVGLGIKTAKGRLDALVSQGQATRRNVRAQTGVKVAAYRMVK